MTLRRAFSLVEALVAVAAIAVIGAALATVFQSVGDTVTGGRELSRFNALASRIEQQMRTDIDAMSREGFLLIRHVSVGASLDDPLATESDLSNPVYLDFEDPSPRARRADELLFFAKGRFESARAPVANVIPNATSSAARIYYGHGVRLPDRWRFPRNVDGTAAAVPVEVTDNRAIASAGFGGFGGGGGGDVDGELRLGGSTAAGTDTLGEAGPNEFAADWTLLRNVALLAEPAAISEPLTDVQIYGETSSSTQAAALRDSSYQIGGQVAAFTPFRTLQVHVEPTGNGVLGGLAANVNVRNSVLRGTAYDDFAQAPVMSSGLVDVLVGSLNGRYTGVRDVVTRLQVDPTVANPVPWSPENAVGAGDSFIAWQDRFGERIPIDGDIADPVADLAIRSNRLYAQQLWMLDALPHGGPSRNFADGSREINQISRMRYDDLAPGWREQLWRLQAEVTGDDREAALRLADQQMLGSSIFVPRCTEFIVEWSLGERVADATNPRFGELIWHGLPRYEDLDRDGVISTGSGDDPEYVVLPYPRVPAAAGSYTTDGEQDNGMLALPEASTAGHSHPPRLFHGPPDGDAFAPDESAVQPGPDAADDLDDALGTEYLGGLELISAFGYFDPTFVATPEVPAVNWPWPKLLRVTVRLAAENDPLNERAFQFVFEVPEKSTF